MGLDDEGTPSPHGQNVLIYFITNPCGMFLHLFTKIYFSHCRFLVTTQHFCTRLFYKLIPEMTNNDISWTKHMHGVLLFLENLSSSWGWGYGILAAYEVFLRRLCDKYQTLQLHGFLRLFIFESCKIHCIFYFLWTINFNEIYKQQANTIDLYLRKLSINLVVLCFKYDRKYKCCVRSASSVDKKDRYPDINSIKDEGIDL